MPFHMTINGEFTDVSHIDPDTPLLWVLRDHLGLVGTKYGSGIAQCGACTVWLDGDPARACQLPVGQLEGRSVTTVEGLAGDTLHPVQQAWVEHDVAQCGYCQAGQIMAAAALLARNPTPSDAEIDGLSTLANQRITIRGGRILETNLDTYPLLRMPRAPKVNVQMMASGYAPTGAGEPALPPLAPAVGNAVFAASGERIRELPFSKAGFIV